MGESGSPLIRDMIKEQLDGAGINLASDEHVVVERVDVIDSYFAILVIQRPHVRRSV